MARINADNKSSGGRRAVAAEDRGQDGDHKYTTGYEERMKTDSVIPASRWLRLIAAIIDAVITVVVTVSIIFILPFLGFDLRHVENDRVFNLALSVLTGVVFLCVNGYLLDKHGQTVGKKILGIKIVSTTEENLTPWRLFILRYMLICVVSSLGLYGLVVAFIDPLLIFTKDRKCLHDLLAGTIVVK